MSEILDYLKQNRNVMLESLERIVKAESPTDDKALADECGALIRRLFEQYLPITTEVYPQQNVGDHYKFTFGEGEEQILLIAHYDTVWEAGRLAYRVEGDKIYGPGILDMKGGIIQALWALIAIHRLGMPLDKKVVFVLTSDEETGSETSRGLIEAEALNSKAVLVPEPAVAISGALKTSRKGIGVYQLRVGGRSTHAGNDHAGGINAIEEIAHQIIKVHSLTDYAKGTTLNVGVIKGGSRSNVVPDYAEAEIDLRVSSLSEMHRIEAALHSLQPVLPGAVIEVTGGINRPPFEKSEQMERIFRQARSIAGRLGFELGEAAVGGVSDGNFAAALGIPTLDGLGPVGDGPHAEYEHILPEHSPYRAALLAHLLLELDLE